jgi:hypothetical protein
VTTSQSGSRATLVPELPNVGMCGGCTAPLELARTDARDDRGRAVGRALVVVSTAQLVLQLDFSIGNIALPTVQRRLHFAPADLQWIVIGYALTLGRCSCSAACSATSWAVASCSSWASPPSV